MTTTTIDKPAGASADGGQWRGSSAARWWVLAVLGVAQLMVVLDATIVNIALPQAQQALGFSDANRQWVVTAYALAFGSLLLLGGRLSDLFGRRNVFMVGLVGFAIASAVGGAATSFEMLVAARAGQGVFGALLAPAALSLLTVTFTEPGERAKAFGVFGAIAGTGAAIGLLLGGVLTEYASWRWALYVNLGFAAVALVGAALLLARHVPIDKPRLDIPGTITVTIALFAVVFGFSRAESDGWGAASTISWLTVGVVLLAVFVYLQSRVSNPLLPLRIVTDRTRAGAYMAVFVTGITMFAIFLFLTYYMQVNLQFSPIATGAAFLPMTATIILASTVSTQVLLAKFGPRLVMTAGFVTATIGMVLLTQIGLETSYVTHVLPGLMVMGLGMGAIFAVAFVGATSGVDHHDAGVASAMVNTMQQVGGSIGTALLSTIAANASADYLIGKGTGASEATGGGVDPVTGANAAIAGYTATFWWAAGFLALGAVLSVLMLRNEIPATEGEPVLAH